MESTPGEVSERLVEELDLSVRRYNCLKRAGIQTVGNLEQMSEARLLSVRGCGPGTLHEVKRALNRLGTSLGSRSIGRQSIDVLALPPHVVDRLRDSEIETVGDLTGISEYGLRQFTEFDDLALQEVTRVLELQHLTLPSPSRTDVSLVRRMERQAEFVRLYHEERLGLREIGERFGITRERVRQVLNEAGRPPSQRPRLQP